MDRQASGWRGEMPVAIALAIVLGTAWAARDWASLTALRLPDTDDVMRLQQVRDWLAGQAFADLTQHRLGAGVPMHWSRLADLGPAFGIIALTPLVGRHAAEVATVVAWPPMLFAVALFLVARITRMLCVSPPTAMVVAAIAYPATTIFVPGRIDHHGLQMVLLLAAVLAALGTATWQRGAAIGTAAIAGLIVGLETAPLLGVLGGALIVTWVVRPDRARMIGLGGAALIALMLARAGFATTAWSFPACDGFDATLWRAGLPLATIPLALGIATPRLATAARRATAALFVAGAALATALLLSPACLHPYGAVDPILARRWLAGVGEAQGLFEAPTATAIGYVGVAVAGLVASAWRWRIGGEHRWAILLALQLGSLGIAMFQLRGAYAGALLAAPGLAAVIAAARARGPLMLAGAWVASAGMLYPIAADAMTTAPTGARGGEGGSCTGPALIGALARLPAGTVMAPIDTGAWAIPATRHRLVAAPYHRNNAGNLASLTFYTAGPAAADAIATRWRVDYTVGCAGARLPPGWRTLARTLDGARIGTRALVAGG